MGHDARVVRGEDEGGAGLRIEALHDLHRLLAVGGIEVGGGLVGQNKGWAGGQGTGDCHALLLAAAHLVGTMVNAVAQAYGVEHFHARGRGARCR